MHESKISIRKVWKEREQPKEEKESLIVQITLKAKNKPAPWILDSSCSSHMTGDKRRFKKLEQHEGGSIKFGNNDGDKIIGKGIVMLGNGKIKSK